MTDLWKAFGGHRCGQRDRQLQLPVDGVGPADEQDKVSDMLCRNGLQPYGPKPAPAQIIFTAVAFVLFA